MWSKHSNIFKEIIKEINLEGSNEKKAEKAYNSLMDETIKGKLSDSEKKEIFNYIKKIAKSNDSNQFVGSKCFLGDCYYYGIGCKKSIDDAISWYNEVINTQGNFAGKWKNWAASKLGNIYLDQKDVNTAKKYIYMSTSAKDYERLADILWENRDERSSLESYKKAGDYGRVECYARAVKRCLSSSDTVIKEKAIEYASLYFKTDEDIHNKQKCADRIMYYFYNRLDKAELGEKEQLKIQFERFKRILDDNRLKKKSERVIKKLFKSVKENAEFLHLLNYMIPAAPGLAVFKLITKKR